MSSRALLIALGCLVLVAGVALFVLLSSSDDHPAAEAAATTSTTEQPSTTTTSPGGSGTTTGAGGEYTPVFEEDDCDFDLTTDREMRCGWLVVPENRAEPDGAEVRIQVAIFESTDPDAPDDPIVYLDGGPGGETLDTLRFSLESTWAPFIENRDVIFFDQRGVGTSTRRWSAPNPGTSPSRCSTTTSTARSTPPGLVATEECRDRLLADDVDLTVYHSATNAADVADLRVALGIDEWNLLGISYGTRLAQTVMRDVPEGVRSVILDSTYSPQEDLTTATPANLVRALEQLWEGCATDPDCSAAYPDLEDRFWALRDHLDTEPLFTDVTDVFTNEEHRAIVNGDTLIGAFFQGLYSVDTIPALPKVVADLEQGDTESITTLLTNNLANGAFFSWGMHLSVECYEEVPFADPAAVDAAPPLPTPGSATTSRAPPTSAGVSTWRVRRQVHPTPLENEPVVSDIPTLVMAGEYDPITPPEWGENAAEYLTNAAFVEFPAVGHAASVSGDCPLAGGDCLLRRPRGPAPKPAASVRWSRSTS